MTCTPCKYKSPWIRSHVLVPTGFTLSEMASPCKRVKTLAKEDWARLYSKFINNDLDLSEVLSHDLHEFLVDMYAKTRGATMGMILPAIIVGENKKG